MKTSFSGNSVYHTKLCAAGQIKTCARGDSAAKSPPRNMVTRHASASCERLRILGAACKAQRWKSCQSRSHELAITAKTLTSGERAHVCAGEVRIKQGDIFVEG